MSSIDERIVSMKFNNGQFQKGVQETASSLDNLKSKLNFDGAAKGLQGISDAGKNFSLANMGSALDGMSAKFSALQTVGITALATLANKAVNMGVDMAKGSMAAVSSGFADYNTKLTSVQTIMNATGADITTVNGYFKELDNYADKTIYNLTDMTGAFAKFTNAGVDMDQSVPAIMGIANMVALAGQDANAASIAMYNLSQSVAGGFLTTTDYKSLNIANVATAEWKQQMIQAAVAAGTLEDLGGDAYHIIGTKAGAASNAAALFNEDLAEGWASSEVMLGVLGDYADVTTDIGRKAMAAAQDVKSFGMMMETLNAATGTGWTDTFELLIGNVTEAKALFTPLTLKVGEYIGIMAEARNSKLDDWKEYGGRTAIINGLVNIFHALEKVMQPIIKAFQEVFPATTGLRLFELSRNFEAFTAKLVVTDKVAERIGFIFKALFSVIKFGILVVVNFIKIFSLVVGTIVQVAGAIIALTAPIFDFFMGLFKGSEKSEDKVGSLYDKLVELRDGGIKPLLAFLGGLKEKFDNFLNGDGGAKFAANVKGGFESVAAFGQKLQDGWSKVGGTFKSVWDFIKPLGGAISNVFSSLGNGFKDTFGEIDMDTILAAINTGIFFVIIKTIKKYMDAGADIATSFKDIVGGVTGVLSAMQTDIKAGALIKIAIAIAILAGSMYLLTLVDPSKLGNGLVAMAAMMAGLVAVLKLLSDMSEDENVSPAKIFGLAAALAVLALAVLLMSFAVSKMAGLNWDELARGLTGMAMAMGVLVGAAKLLDTMKTDVMDGAKAMVVMAAAIWILSMALQVFAAMSWEELAKAGAALTVILGLVVGALLLLSLRTEQIKGAAAAILIISIAISILAGAIAFLGLIPAEVLVQGLTAVAIMLGLLAAAILLLSLNNAATMAAAVSLVAMAVAIAILVGAVYLLGNMDMAVLNQGLQALAVMLGMLVIAMYGMTGALVGAGATLVVAASIVVLAFAIQMLGSMPLDVLNTGLQALVAVFIILAAAGLLLGPLAPVLLLLGAALALVGIGMMLMAGSVMLLSLGLMMFGPAAMVASEGLKALSAAVIASTDAFPGFLLLAAGLLLFGVGALAAAVGVAALGVALIIMGLGLTIIGAMGLIGATALTAVVRSLLKLLPETFKMIALGAAFGLLGGGLVVLGAGAILAGAGLILVGSGLIMVAYAVTLFAVASKIGASSMGTLGKAVEKLSPQAPAITALASAISNLGTAGSTAASGTKAAATSLNDLSTACGKLGTASSTASTTITTSFGKINTALNNSKTVFSTATSGMVTSLESFSTGVNNSIPRIVGMVSRLGSDIAGSIRGAAGTVRSAGNTVGTAIVDGMANGLSNGSYKVTAAATSVATQALAASKRTLGVASPSKEYFKIGGWSDEGMANGLLAGAGVVKKASSHVGTVALTAIKDSISDMSSVINDNMNVEPTIRPVLDLSAIKKDGRLIADMMDTPILNASASAISAGYNADVEAANAAALEKSMAPIGTTASFVQNNYSPTALSAADIYRQTRNQISTVKGVLTI